MRKYKQDKLWRDKAPKLMEDQGSIIHIKSLTDNEYDSALRTKVIEEAQEIEKAQTTHELASEIADVYDVLDALITLHKLDVNEIAAIRTKKNNERGGFAQRKFVTYAQHPEDSFGEKYCLADPEKYPEIIE